MTGENEKQFLDALDEHWDDYRKQLKSGRQEISEDSIHDLRVAARRFLAMLNILRSLDSHPHVKQVRRFLKKQLNQLDDLRDAHVMLAETTQKVQELPQLAPFEGYLVARCNDLAQAAGRHINNTKPSDLKPRVKPLRKVAQKHSDDEDLLAELLQAVDQAHARTLERFGELNDSDPATIHHVRIAFKNFRYMVETIQPFLQGYPAGYLERMHDYQDAMGKVHDTTVYLDRLHEFEESVPTPPRGAPPAFDSKPVEAYYRKRLDDLIRAYFERKDELHQYWRAASYRPFPWEKSHDRIHRSSRNRRGAGPQPQRRTRQPAASNAGGAQEDAPDRARAEGAGITDRPDRDQPVPPGG